MRLVGEVARAIHAVAALVGEAAVLGLVLPRVRGYARAAATPLVVVLGRPVEHRVRALGVLPEADAVHLHGLEPLAVVTLEAPLADLLAHGPAAVRLEHDLQAGVGGLADARVLGAELLHHVHDGARRVEQLFPRRVVHAEAPEGDQELQHDLGVVALVLHELVEAADDLRRREQRRRLGVHGELPHEEHHLERHVGLAHARHEQLDDEGRELVLVHEVAPGRVAREVVGAQARQRPDDLHDEVRGRVVLGAEAEERAHVRGPDVALAVLALRVLRLRLEVEGPERDVARDLGEQPVLGAAEPLDELPEAAAAGHDLGVPRVEAEVHGERAELPRHLRLREVEEELHDDGHGVGVGEERLAAVRRAQVVQELQRLAAEGGLLQQRHELGQQRGLEHLLARLAVEAQVEQQPQGHVHERLVGTGQEPRDARHGPGVHHGLHVLLEDAQLL
mmetsp:Transcript_33145/g.104855  ORF Transcript_33145/g.104855 Transcript_33145/m.104855 type:complete len:449 (-) Transcript_33145:1063-2409(-)